MTIWSAAGQSLQTRGEIGRAAHRGDPGSAGPNLAAGDDHTGGDPDTHVQRHACCGRELRHSLDQCEAGSDGALSVMLIRLRITEIGQHAVSSVVGDIAMVSLDDIRAAPVTSSRHLAQVFEIEAARELPKPATSQAKTVSCRRSADGATGRLTFGSAEPVAVRAPGFGGRSDGMKLWTGHSCPSETPRPHNRAGDDRPAWQLRVSDNPLGKLAYAFGRKSQRQAQRNGSLARTPFGCSFLMRGCRREPCAAP